MVTAEQVQFSEEGPEKASKRTLSLEYFISDISVLICCPAHTHQLILTSLSLVFL